MELDFITKSQIYNLIASIKNKVTFESIIAQKDKYEDHQILELLIDLLLESFNKKYTTSEIYLETDILSTTSYIIRYYTELNDDKINLILARKLKQIHPTYVNFLNYNVDKYSERINQNVLHIKQLVDQRIVTSLETLSSYEKELIELKETLMQQQNTLEELTKQITGSNKKIEQDKKKLAKKEEAIIKLNQQIASLKKQIKDLESQIHLKFSNKNDLEKKIEQQTNDIEVLKHRCEDVNKLYSKKADEVVKKNEEITELQQQLDQIRLLAEKEQAQKEETSRIHCLNDMAKKVMIKELLNGKSTFKALTDALTKNNIKISQEAAYQAIQSLMKTFAIKCCGVENGSPIYTLDKTVPANNEFKIQTQNEYIDVLFISNLAIDEDEEKLKSTMSQLYNYCIIHNVNYVFNIGSFFDLTKSDDALEDIDRLKKLVHIAFCCYPRDHNIINCILGGTHDINGLELGLNPISTICNERSDFQNLGYGNATITLSNTNTQTIEIHQAMDTSNIDTVNKYLNDFYGNRNTRPNLDVIGSINGGIICFPQNFITVTPINNPTGIRGAFHLRVNTVSKNNDMIFLPLIMQDKVIATAKVLY